MRQLNEKEYSNKLMAFKSYRGKLKYWIRIIDDYPINKILCNPTEAIYADIYPDGLRESDEISNMEVIGIERTLRSLFPKPQNSKEAKVLFELFDMLARIDRKLPISGTIHSLDTKYWYKDLVLVDYEANWGDMVKRKEMILVENEIDLIKILTQYVPNEDGDVFHWTFDDYYLNRKIDALLDFRTLPAYLLQIYNGIELAKYKISLEKKLIELRTKKKSPTIIQKEITDFRSLFENDDYFTRMLNTLVLDGQVKRHKNNYYSWELGYPAMGVLGAIIKDHFKNKPKSIKNQDLARSMSAFFGIEYNSSVNKAFQPEILEVNLDTHKEFEKIKGLSPYKSIIY
jgi:hypothetical protein